MTERTLKVAEMPGADLKPPYAEVSGEDAVATDVPGAVTPRTTDDRLKRRLPRSGGPRTAEGKARSSLNSLKHWAYANPSLLTLRDGYYDFANAVKVELQPQGQLETATADSIAHEAFRNKLIEETEMHRVRASEYKRLDPGEVALRMGFPFAEEYQYLLVEPMNSVQLLKDFLADWHELAAPPVAAAGGGLETNDDSKVVKIYKTASEMMERAQINPHCYGEFLETIDAVMVAAMRGQNYLGRRISERGKEIMLVHYWLIVNKTELSICTNDMRCEHKLGILTDDKLSRAKRHVNANLNSSLNQLAAIRKIKQGSE